MYDRRIDGKTLTLAVSGMLWDRSLVMRDQETGSLWSHLLGQAMQGRLKGKRLRQIPSLMTDWQSWRSEYPDGTVVVLPRSSRHYTRQFYRVLDRFVLGIVGEREVRAWPFDLLQQRPAINDQFDGTPVLVAFDRASFTARLYDRRLADQVLTFRAVEGHLQDEQTGSRWDPVTGRSVGGPLQGKYLRPLPAIVSYRRAWSVFHPDSQTAAP